MQVEVVHQRWEFGSIYGLICSRLSVQHTASTVWVSVSPALLVVHGPHPLGRIFGHGYSWLCIFLPVHLQNLCICEGRLGLQLTLTCCQSIPVAYHESHVCSELCKLCR